MAALARGHGAAVYDRRFVPWHHQRRPRLRHVVAREGGVRGLQGVPPVEEGEPEGHWVPRGGALRAAEAAACQVEGALLEASLGKAGATQRRRGDKHCVR
eukprot:1196001-Prorocentrum_minimum.AAC.9